MINFLWLINLLSALALISAGFLGAGDWRWALGALVSGSLLAGGFFWKRWLANAGFFGLLVCCIYGALLQWPAWQFGLALICSLAAWDLVFFAIRLRPFKDAAASRLPGRHVMQLSLILGGGAGLSVLALNGQFVLGFEAALLLAVMAAVGLAQVIRLLRDRDEPHG